MARDFAPYQTRGRVAAPSAYYIQPGNLHYSNAGEQALAKVKGETGLIIAKGLMDMKEQYETGKVLEANNEYNRLMSEGTAELMQKKQEAALNVVDDYDKLHQKTIEQVQKKYGAFIGFGRAAQAFNVYTERDNTTRRNNMLKYQMDQTEAYRDTQYNNQLATCVDIVGNGGYSDPALAEGLNRAEPLVRQRWGAYGEEMVQQQLRAVQNQMVGAAMQFAVNTSDYARMGELASKYNNVLDAKTRVTVLSMLGKRQKEAHELAQANDLWAKFGNNATRDDIRQYVIDNAKNLGSLQGLFAKMESLCGVEMDNGRNGCVEYSMKALSQFCKFGAANADQRNVGNLCRAAQADNSGASLLRYNGQQLHAGDIIVYATPGDDISNFDNLEHVTVSDGNGGYYGNSSGARDYEDENGNYVRGNGCGVHSDDQNIGGYEIAYIIRPDDMTSKELTDLEIEEQTDKLWAQYEKKYQQNRTAENRLIEQGELEQQNLINQGVEDPDAYDAIANKYGIMDGVVNERVLITLQKRGGHIRNILAKQAEREAAQESGSGGGGGKKTNDAFARVEIRRMLENGVPLDEIFEYIDTQNFSNGKDLIKMCFNYKDGKGEFAVNWNALKQEAKGKYKTRDDNSFEAQWDLAQDRAWEQYKDYQKDHDGDKPTQDDMRKWIFESFAYPEIVTDPKRAGKPFDSTETVPKTYGELAERGVGNISYDPRSGNYIIELMGGQYDGYRYSATKEQYQRIINGENAVRVLFEG